MTALTAFGPSLSLPRGVLRPAAILALAVVGLSACDEDSVTRQGIDTLGDGFVSAFNLAPTDEPVDAQSVELTATPGIEPFDP